MVDSCLVTGRGPYQATRHGGGILPHSVAQGAEIPVLVQAETADCDARASVKPGRFSSSIRATEARRHAGLERFASLSAPRWLTDFDFDAQPSVDRALVNELGTLRFLEEATNVLLIGSPGVRHVALLIGCAAR